MNGEADLMPCFRCGVCCNRYQVRISFLEARRIADGLGLGWEEFLGKYVEEDEPETETFRLRRNGKACVFLENVDDGNMTRCLIHAFKPFACREWNPSLHRQDCQEGLASYRGLTVNSLGGLEGSDYDLRRFLCFLKSLLLSDKGTQRYICSWRTSAHILESGI